MDKEYFDEIIKSIKESIENEKEKLIIQKEVIKNKQAVLDEMTISSQSQKQMSITDISNKLMSLDIHNKDLFDILNTVLQFGLDEALPLTQYNNIMSKVLPLLEEKQREYNNLLDTLNEKVTRYSKYSDINGIKDNISEFEKDILTFSDVDPIQISLALCLISCDDYNLKTKEEQVEEKYEELKAKKEEYNEIIKKEFEYQIKRFETIDIYNSSLEYSSDFYKLHNELTILCNNYKFDSIKIDNIFLQINKKNISEYYDQINEIYSLIKQDLEKVKEKMDECLEIYESINKQSIEEKEIKEEIPIEEKNNVAIEKLPEETTKQGIEAEDIKAKEESQIEEEIENISYERLDEEKLEIIDKAENIYQNLISSRKIENFIEPLNQLLTIAKNDPSPANIEPLNQILETIEMMAKLNNCYEEIIPEEEIIEADEQYEGIGTKNIILFLKNVETQEFYMEQDLEALSTAKAIKTRTEKEVKGLIEKITNAAYDDLTRQKAGQGKGNKFLKPLHPDKLREWEGIKPMRAIKGESRSAVIQLKVSDNIKNQIKENGYEDLDQIILMGGVIGQKKDKDLNPLASQIEGSLSYVEFLNNLLSNPQANINEIMEIIKESNQVYSKINKSKSR